MLQKNHRFLFYSENLALGSQLSAALDGLGLLTQESPTDEALPLRFTETQPQMAFLDFMPHNDDKHLKRSVHQATMLARLFPHIPRVAIGKLSEPGTAIAALRAGVTDFIDPDQKHDFLDAVHRMLLAAGTTSEAPSRQGSILLLGARVGVGTSTLAVHLAGLMQNRLTLAANPGSHGKSITKTSVRREGIPLSERACLLDLGMPVADCLLYLNMRSDFHFMDAVQNLRRLDNTLLSSALPHNQAGISALALPRTLEQMRDASLADSLALFERLRDYFGLLITDAGGLSNPQFIAGLAQTATHTWVVTDQSVGALVSLADLLDELDEQQFDRSGIRLVVNRYDPRYGMNAAQIADRFKLTLQGTLPDHTLALRNSMNIGKLLIDGKGRDPYVKALQALTHGLLPEPIAPAQSSHWLSEKFAAVRRHTAARRDQKQGQQT